MHTNELVICGLAADMCVQLTAAEAFLREYKVWVPSDCTAADVELAEQIRHLSDGVAFQPEVELGILDGLLLKFAKIEARHRDRQQLRGHRYVHRRVAGARIELQ